MYTTLHSIYVLFYSIKFYVCRFLLQVNSNKKLVKYNQVNKPYCDIKYLNLHWSLKFFELYFYVLFMIVLCNLFTKWFMIYLI